MRLLIVQLIVTHIVSCTVSKLSQIIVQILDEKRSLLVFETHLGSLWATYDDHLKPNSERPTQLNSTQLNWLSWVGSGALNALTTRLNSTQLNWVSFSRDPVFVWPCDVNMPIYQYHLLNYWGNVWHLQKCMENGVAGRKNSFTVAVDMDTHGYLCVVDVRLRTDWLIDWVRLNVPPNT